METPCLAFALATHSQREHQTKLRGILGTSCSLPVFPDDTMRCEILVIWKCGSDYAYRSVLTLHFTPPDPVLLLPPAVTAL